MKKNEPEKKRFPIMAAGAAVLAACLVLPAVISRIEKEDVITSAQLEKAISVSCQQRNLCIMESRKSIMKSTRNGWTATLPTMQA